jgi:CHASE3 domain sensor protein
VTPMSMPAALKPNRGLGPFVALDDLLSTAKDAETGQRGYLLTEDPKYLEPYGAAKSALRAKLDKIADLTADNPRQQSRIAMLRRISTQRSRSFRRRSTSNEHGR